MNRNAVRFVVLALLCCSSALAQGDPFSDVASKIWLSMTGPIARLCTGIALVASCLTIMFSRGEGVGRLGQVVIGGTGAMMAVQVMGWLW